MVEKNQDHTDTVFSSIEDAIEAVAQGKMIIVVDDKNRENEGDLFMAAELITPEQVNFMITKGKGLLCAPITVDIAKRLDIPLMTLENSERQGTKFTISVDVTAGTTTGISASERAKTLVALADPKTSELENPPTKVIICTSDKFSRPLMRSVMCISLTSKPARYRA
ncbi:MAG: 3,4-dihydroxy 2-butanone 4-phosphate synthase / cyclohydrolase [Candidatus Cloacimonadota bacterium]|nr:3,4-dihydroxy 2-butanone 4-phosphate synthase / cyclohydrolase [Candidatus Cloacimonadota bacterium]